MFQSERSPVSARRRIFMAVGLLIVASGVAFGGVANAANEPNANPGHNGKSVQALSTPTSAPLSTLVTTTVKPSLGTTVTPAGCPNTYHGVNTGDGANVLGAYDSTCNGAPSMNGSGSGAATGEKCAGCVGNADYKNPAGQAPNGSDNNKGYECDGNKGVGQTNSAHSGCTKAVTSTTVTVKPKEMPKQANKPTTTSTPAKVLGKTITAPTSTTVAPTTATTINGKMLAFTGTNVMKPILIGSILLIIGITASLVLWRRKVRSAKSLA